jgi:hypothetical protein
MKLKIVTNSDSEVLVDITSDFLQPIPRIGESVTSLPHRVHKVRSVAYSYGDETVVNVWCTERD